MSFIPGGPGPGARAGLLQSRPDAGAHRSWVWAAARGRFVRVGADLASPVSGGGDIPLESQNEGHSRRPQFLERATRNLHCDTEIRNTSKAV